MTQKELLYVEDAIEHEGSIIKICNDLVNGVNNEEFKSFINNEITNHQGIKNNLISLLKENVNG